ncbi:Hypothetical Protein FCC1311_054192 [Hondaea fermentalgiana]|uniref:Uncharacterized protein n=1 Tax=Hondaea fermentalgiana TaxID=2315210 RepID=A0A2R5GE38_9STRA|nr:Hypothetical Protein FCC1311_054192 [Hondaea fermentalgiana]|eukprot:GBG29197.1 Hypothetical Protein FCC1311_054192 [Hondaea fermentalgiana]
MAEASAEEGMGSARVRFARTEDGTRLRPLWVLLPGHLDEHAMDALLESVDTRVAAARETQAGRLLGESLRAVGLEMQAISQPVCKLPLLVKFAHTAFAAATNACKIAYAARHGAEQQKNSIVAELSSDVNAARDLDLDLDMSGLDRERETLTSLGWLYGPKSSMVAHHDTPTFAGSQDEWLVSFNAGLTMIFEADGEELPLSHGDVVVMDTLAVKHGVRRIIPDSAPSHCSLQDARLGLLLWSSFNPDVEARAALAADEMAAAEGVSGLFPSDSEDDEVDEEGEDN